jgi:starch synthase
MNKILYVSSEAFPLIKTGGLGDVSGSLPRALQKIEQDVRLLLPAYRQVLDKVGKCKLLASHFHYGQEIRLLETRLPGTRVKTWLVDCPRAFDRAGNPYVDSRGHGWHDNAFRFAVFAQVAVDIAMNRALLNWQPDIVHCNDWQSGLVPALLSEHDDRPATVFTIHNMAYQGLFPSATFRELGLPAALWGMDGLEFYDQLSFIKGGLAYADRINTVSPTYAREIQTPEYGYGLDGLLRHRSQRLSGITNGIDGDIWNPGTDKHITSKYNRRQLAKKTENKTALQEQLGLPVDAGVPLLGMISRLVEQKGLDIILGSLLEIVNWPVQLVILGSGEHYYETALSQWSEQYPDKIKVVLGYDETLSHRIEAAADIYLMPSTFEPCGLNQLYSLRYGTLPVVGNVGGLADTVVDCNATSIKNRSANGFVIGEHSSRALTECLQRALEYFDNRELWNQLQHTAMARDSSWQHSALEYVALYEQALADSKRA